jgi:hypothetical protein
MVYFVVLCKKNGSRWSLGNCTCESLVMDLWESCVDGVGKESRKEKITKARKNKVFETISNMSMTDS